MLQYKVHLYDKDGNIIEEGIWYRFGENVLLKFDDPVELLDFAENIANCEEDVISEWRQYTE